MAFLFFAKKKPAGSKPTVEDYEALGKQVAALYDTINPDRKSLYRTAFFKGIVTGLGSVIGATVVIALLVWLLSLAGSVWFIGPIVDNFKETIQSR